MSRFLLFFCFSIAIVLLLTLKLTVRLPPRLDKASVRQLRKKLQPTSPVLIVDTVIDSTRKSLKRNITKIPTTKKIILKKVIQRQNTRKKKPIIAICAATHSTSTWKTLSDTTLQKLMIPSIKKSITTNDKNTYDFHLYLAADHDDAFWLKNKGKIQVPYWLSLHFHFFTVPLHKIPFNQMMRKAYDDGAEYMVRINDDSQFITSNWVSTAVKTLASYDPPNVGMVGPNCKEGNTGIMTHDMVHRTHLKIFPHYYPDVFSAWYVDDWITHVYGQKRSTKIMNWLIKHHVNTHGTRYRVDTSQKNLLDTELSKGKLRIANWLQKMKSKKVISYSLYGSNERYTQGAIENAKLYTSIYPGWIMRVYYDNTVPSHIIDKLKAYRVELKDMSDSMIKTKTMWRFLAVSDSKYACIRDIDSRLSTREAFAVKEWIESNKKFHVMRDHPSHSEWVMNAGMWGGTSIPHIELLVLSAEKRHSHSTRTADQIFLKKYIWPIVKESVLQHDSFSCIKFGAKPFPTARVGWEHIGSVFINGKMREGDVDILKRAKQPCNKKQSIPNGRSNDFITNKKYISMCDVGYKTRSKNDFKLPIKPHSVICAQGSKQTLTEFFKLNIQAPFTLVTIEMDDAIPQETPWLNHKHLKRWYSWNSNHPDIIPIPIGLNEDSQLEPMMKANVHDIKINKILVNFKQDRTERKNLFSQVKDLPYAHVETYRKKWENKHDLTAHYESISKYKWTLCPRGAGQDTHRLWEAIYLGSIPIVLKSSISSLYEDLPVIQLNNWDELSLSFLEKRSKELPLTRTNAYFSHWQKKIRVGTEMEKDLKDTSMCTNFEKIEKHMANIDLKKGVKDSTEEKLLVRISPFLDTANSISVDIGGNQGLFSKLLQKIFKKEPKYIFDVIPRFVTKLKDMFPSSNVEQLAMSDVLGKTVDILGAATWKTEFNTGASILNRGNSYGHVLTSVKTTTLDNFFLEKEKIYFLKIDTEGMDGRVLHGAKQMLKEKRIQSIFWENNKMQNSIGDSLYKNVQYLNSLGYASFQVGHDILFPISECRKEHRVFLQNAPTGNILSIIKNARVYNFLNEQQPSMLSPYYSALSAPTAKQPYPVTKIEWGTCEKNIFDTSLRDAANKKWRIVLSSDLNPNYLSFLPSAVAHWKKFGLEVSVALVVTSGDTSVNSVVQTIQSSMNVDIRVLKLDLDADLPVGHAAKLARGFIATQFDMDVVTIVDIDYYLMWFDKWSDHLRCTPTDGLLALGYNMYFGTKDEGKYPMYLGTARSTTFAQFLNPTHENDFNKWIRKFKDIRVFDKKESPYGVYGSFSDESLFRALLSQKNIPVVWVNRPKTWRRINRLQTHPVTKKEILRSSDVFPNRPLANCHTYFKRTAPVHKFLGILDISRDSAFVEKLRFLKLKHRDWAQQKYKTVESLYNCLQNKSKPKPKPKFIAFLKDMLIQNKLIVNEFNNKLKVVKKSASRKYECTIDINRIKVTQTKRWSDIFETNVNALARLTRFSIDEIKQIQQRSPLPSNNDPIYIVGRDDKNVMIPEKATIIRFNQHDHNKRTTLRATWDHHLLDFIHKFGVGPNKLIKWTHRGKYVGFWNTSSPIIVPKNLWKSNQLRPTLIAKTPLYFLKSNFLHYKKNWIDCPIVDGIGLFVSHILFDLKAPKTLVGMSLLSDDYNFYATNTGNATRRNRWNIMIYKNIYNAISQYSTL